MDGEGRMERGETQRRVGRGNFKQDVKRIIIIINYKNEKTPNIKCIILRAIFSLCALVNI